MKIDREVAISVVSAILTHLVGPLSQVNFRLGVQQSF